MLNKVVLITGGLTGIGRATALAFAKEGATVVVSGRSDREGDDFAAELKELGGQAGYIKADVRIEEDVRNLIDQAVSRFSRIDVAVNCAGTEGKPGLIVDQTPESFAASFDTNVLGTLLSLKHEIRAMQAQGKGSIVNISSSYGKTGAAYASVYSASKHAVEGPAALELAGSGIRVNLIAPGPIDTGMLSRFTGTDEAKASLAAGVPWKRIGHPDEIAAAILMDCQMVSDPVRTTKLTPTT